MSNEVRFVYVRGVERPVTVAYRFNDERGVIEYNSAQCGQRDFFSKKIGRAVASGRLNADKQSHPNGAISYAEVSAWDQATNTNGPRYNIIAATLAELFS